MKHFMYSFAIAFISLLLFRSNDAAAQGTYKIKKIKFWDTCGSRLQVSINDTAVLMGSKAELTYGDGTVDTINTTWSDTWADHTYPGPGTYNIKVVLMDAAYLRKDSMTITETLRGCNTFLGYLFNDYNHNCVYDYVSGGETPLSSPILIQVDSAGYTIDTISSSMFGTYGGFIYQGKKTGVLYTFTALSAPAYMTLSCVASVSGVSSFASIVNPGDIGFVYGCDTGSHYDASLHTYTCAGKANAKILAVLTNTACSTKTGTITLVMDARYSITSINPAGGTISGSTVTWNYTNSSIDSPLVFTVFGTASPLLSMGDVVTSQGWLDGAILFGDVDTANNHFTAWDTVKSSFDPNEKKVSPEGNIEPAQRLTYTIAFENTGTAAAEHVYVMDTLSEWLDVATLQVESSTHKMNLVKGVDAVSGKTVLKFDFPGIMLADKTHPAENTGYLTFSINVKAAVARGTDVSNSAGIYFDDNDVIITNTVVNTIRSLGINDPSKANSIKIYPNPVHDICTLSLNQQDFEYLSVINTLGQVVQQQVISNKQTSVDMSQLTPGVYFLLLQGTADTQTIKIEKR